MTADPIKVNDQAFDFAALRRQLQAVTAERDRLRAEVARLREALLDLGAWRVDR